MREIKFRYRIKIGGKVITSFITLDTLEHANHGVSSNILSRDEYTGLKDENGVEIYERSWFKSELGQGEVIYENGCFWVLERLRPGLAKYALHELGNNHGHFPNLVPGEVIGDIYENGELPK